MAIEGKITSLYTDKTMSEALLPRTNTKAITDDKGVNLNAILNQVAYVDTENSEAAVAPLNADTLAGFPADNYASKTYVSNEIAKAQLGGGSGEGEIDLSGFATKDDIATSANTTLDSAKTYTNDKIATIDFPVDSVNGKTGAVSLSAEDVGAFRYLGYNIISSVADDTTAKWSTIDSGYSFFNTAGLLNNQPAQYGILVHYRYSNDIFQIWRTQSAGPTYWRSGNNGGWNCPWTKVYDEQNKPTASDVGAAPSGYGLGNGGKLINEGDNLNNYTRGGWYQLTKGVANAPTDWGLMITVPGSGYLTDCYQVVFSRYPENKVYFRQLFDGTWKSWVDWSPSAFAPAGYKTKLWQNASRTSSFAPQTISVNLSGYDEVEVYYCLETSSDFNKHMVSSICPVGESLFATFTFGSASATYSRGATTSTSGVNFSNGYQSGSISNASLVPYRIFGIKGVK